MYFVDSGRPLTGAPPLLKTRRHMRRDAARKLWRKLQEQGWRQVQQQWGAEGGRRTNSASRRYWVIFRNRIKELEDSGTSLSSSMLHYVKRRAMTNASHRHEVHKLR